MELLMIKGHQQVIVIEQELEVEVMQQEGKEEKNYPSLLFELLFHPKNELVYAMIKKQETLEYLQKGPQGSIELFGIKFEKILKNLS